MITSYWNSLCSLLVVRHLQAEICAGLPVMALTATATTKVIDDIIKSLKIQRCQRFQVIPPYVLSYG